MRKTLFFILSLVFALPCSAREYTRDSAIKAAAAFLPKGQEAQFVLIEMKAGDENVEPLLKMLRSARESKALIALVSPKNRHIKANLEEVVRMANGERFEGVKLIVVGEKIAPEMFVSIMKSTGLDLQFGKY